MSLPCPYCGALANEPCRNMAVASKPLLYPHPERLAADSQILSDAPSRHPRRTLDPSPRSLDESPFPKGRRAGSNPAGGTMPRKAPGTSLEAHALALALSWMDGRLVALRAFLVAQGRRPAATRLHRDWGRCRQAIMAASKAQEAASRVSPRVSTTGKGG